MRTWNFICGWQRTNRSLSNKGGRKLRRRIPSFTARAFLAACMAAACSKPLAAENELEEAGPDLEFLEFLGQFETDTGEWIEPNSLLGEGIFELLDLPATRETDDQPAQTDDAIIDDQ